MSDPIIQVEGLEKRFKVYRRREGRLGALRGLVSREHRIVRAVDGLDFALEPGELVGFLGPNGAGKSTTIKMLTGILVPSAGSVRVGGYVPWRDRLRYTAQIGVVFGQRTSLWWDLPVIDSFEILRQVYRIPAERYAANLRRFDALLELGAFWHTPVRQISLGQRMRADLAAALLHDPALLFLDEPTIGLDVVAREGIRNFIRESNRERGVTVILTTHDMGDVERLCRRVLVIAAGRALFDGDLETLRQRFGAERELLVDFEDAPEFAEIEGARLIERQGRRLTYRFRRDEISASELIGRLAARHRIEDLSLREPDIEGVVRRFYEQEGPSAEPV
jgi:ABC-2 type transport system ATP-binding protein